MRRLVLLSLLIALAAGFPGVERAVAGDPKAPTAADVPADAGARIKALLNRYPAVRVKMGPSPGSGHQQAGLRMIQRLRELGFQGRVQLIYNDSTGAKLGYLVPGFRQEELGLQTVDSPTLGKLELIAESKAAPYIQAEKMGLGLSGALDQRYRLGQNEAFNVEASLQLQPRRWAHRESLREIRFGDEEPVSLQHLWNLGAGVKEEAIKDWPAFLEKELANSSAPIKEKLGGLRTLMGADADLLPAYSIDYTGYPDQIMTEVMKGVKRAVTDHPERFTKPIVVPILTEFKSEGQRTWVDTAMGRLGHRMVNVKAEDLAAQLSAAKPGEILLVEVGQVPPPVFEGIFKSEKATLPALLEGKNLTNAMVDAGKPFLNILGSIDDIKPELLGPGVSDEAQALVTNAHEAMTKQRFQNRMWGKQNIEALAKYYADAKAPGSAAKKFFGGLKRNPAALEQDLVAMSLLELEKQIAGRANGTIVPKLTAVPGGPATAAACPQQFNRFRGGGRSYGG